MNGYKVALRYMFIMLAILIAVIITEYCVLSKETKTINKTEEIKDLKPIIIKSKPIHDSIPYIVYKTVSKTDTITLRDTIYLPQVQHEYKNKDYHLWISGYKPKLDSIIVFKKYTERIHYKQPRFSIGLICGYGTNFRTTTPFIGIGITYNIINF